MTTTTDWLFNVPPPNAADEARFRRRHAAWADLITSGGHIAWSDGHVTPYMSAWCVYQRYCRLNATSGAELLEPVDPGARWKGPCRPHRSFLNPESWLPMPRRRDREHNGLAFAGVLTALRSAGLTRWAGKLTFALAEDDSARLCPACLALGYQSAFAQITGIARCPIHGLPYQVTCPHCGAPLPPFRFDRNRDPTRCQRCGHLLLAPDQDIQEFPLRFRQRECEALSGLAAWLEAASANVVNWSSTEFPRRAEMSEPLAVRSRALWVLDAVRSLPYDLRPYLVAPPSALRSTHVRGINMPWAERKYEALTGDAAIDRRRVLASIRRHIVRCYLPGHRRCLRGARRYLFIMSEEDGTRFALRKEDGCYTAQAFTFWKYAMQYRFRHSSPFALDPANFLQPSAANSDLRVWAHQVLAAFHERFVAMRLAYHLEAGTSGPHAHMSMLDPDVRDVAQRLEFQNGGLDLASTVISLKDGDTVVIGRGAHPGLGASSCPHCRIPELATVGHPA